MSRRARLSAVLLSLAACTDASVYQVNGAGQEGPDRTMLEGTICAPIPTGESFPVKIVFAVEGGNPPVLPQDTASIIQALQGVESVAPPGTTFALISFHTVALQFTQGFVTPSAFQAALSQLQGATAQQTGPVSLTAPLDLANAIISGDMQTGCKGTLQRTHYVVMLLLASADVTCTNAAYSQELCSICTGGSQLQSSSYCSCVSADQGQSCVAATAGNAAGPSGCEACVLNTSALNLKDLPEQSYGGGTVSVVPVYFRDFNAASDAGAAADPTILGQIQDIVAAAGTAPIVTDTASLAKILPGNPSFNSLLSAPILSRFFAWNRNVVARGGQELVDSDGDGLPDQDETNLFGSDPTQYSTAQDGIGDGVKVHLGLNPDAGLAFNTCQVGSDEDGDRLNDCEEQLLETDPCAADTDGDGLSDLVEVSAGTNPLVPEGDKDSDGDGVSNAIEVETHTDPLTSDLAFRAARAYAAATTPGTPTPDGRPCYDFQIGDISLMQTLQTTDGFNTNPAGTNFVYLFGEWSYANGAEISQYFIQQITYTPPAPSSPPPPLLVAPTDFIQGT